MGSRRCCSCGVLKPERCKECCSNCISAHKIEYKPGVHTFANQNIRDVFTLHHGAGVDTGGKCTDSGRVTEDAIIKIEYINTGSYWTWWHPAFMINFDPSFPPCTNMTNRDAGTSSYPALAPVGADFDLLGYNRIFWNLGLKYQRDRVLPDALTANGFYKLHAPDSAVLTDFPRFNRIFGLSDPYECRNTVDCPGDYFGCAASMNVYINNPPLVPNNINGGPVSFRFGYPCSTDSEDICCGYGGWWNHGGGVPGSGSGSLNGFEVDKFSPYNETPWGGKPSNAVRSCNFLGLSKYQRRMFRTYFPWAWQIFSYSFDHLIPFGNAFHDWAEIQDPETNEIERKLIKYGALTPIKTGYPENIFEPTGFIYYPMSPSSKTYWGDGPGVITPTTPVPCAGDNTYAFTQQRASSLRHQFLGFAFCEHQYDKECGRQEVLGDPDIQIPLATVVPVRFTFACSGIPMFEFDLLEAVKDEILQPEQAQRMIACWKAFTMWFENPNNDSTNATFLDREIPIYSLAMPQVRHTPSQEEAQEGQFLMDILSARNYSGLMVKDWRDEAYDEIIEANRIYRECIRDTYILRNYTDTTKTAQEIKQYAEDYAESIFDLGVILGFGSIANMQTNKNTLLPIVFPSQLGPIRKRCRQNNPAFRTEGEAEWAGSSQLVTRNSYFGLNVLTPMNIFPRADDQRSISFGGVDRYNELGNRRVDDSDLSIGIDTPWKYQSLYYADISKPLFKEDEYMPNKNALIQPSESSVGTQNGKWNTDVYGLRYSEFDVHCDMVNRISHLCYTYFFAQPSGWDFTGRGPFPNYRSEYNWWARRFGRIEERFDDIVTYFGTYRKHSSITGCGVSNIGNFEYSWNPSRNNLIPPCG
jgi:hypothetical protein